MIRKLNACVRLMIFFREDHKFIFINEFISECISQCDVDNGQ